MAKKPCNMAWLGFTPEQSELLDSIDFYGNNGWDRNGQSDALMPGLLAECEAAGLSIERIKTAMESIGYSRQTVHQLSRWESKRTTGRFDPPRRGRPTPRPGGATDPGLRRRTRNW